MFFSRKPDTIPKGVILLWSGSQATIPFGWNLCNGLLGTVDLRNRFIVGAGGSYTEGEMGAVFAEGSDYPAYYALAYIQKL